jgi:putative methanogenesis marker protein 7
MYEVMMFDGGVYRVNELYELVEDVGGFILQKNQMQQMIIVTFAIPEEEHDVLDRKTEELGGKLIEVPLAGTEIAVVAPTLGRHHMPHPVCDIAEHLRRYGAITVVMGLARGKGRRTAQISTDERALIDEYDTAVFVLGNFKDCIEKEKIRLFEQIQIPVVVACGPKVGELDNCEGLVCGIGRKAERMRRADEIAKLEEVAQAVEQVIKDRRRALEEDPLFVHPAEIKQRLEGLQVVKESLRPAPIVLHQDGLRVKIPFEENRAVLESLVVYGRKLKDITEMSESRLGNSTLIKILTKAEIEARGE